MNPSDDYYEMRDQAWEACKKNLKLSFEGPKSVLYNISRLTFFEGYDVAYKLGVSLGDKNRIDIIQNALTGIEPRVE